MKTQPEPTDAELDEIEAICEENRGLLQKLASAIDDKQVDALRAGRPVTINRDDLHPLLDADQGLDNLLGAYLVGDLRDWAGLEGTGADRVTLFRLPAWVDGRYTGWTAAAVYYSGAEAVGYYVGGDCPLVGRQVEEVAGLGFETVERMMHT